MLIEIQRKEAPEPYYNAFIFMNPGALDDAKAADARRTAGQSIGPFDGLPVVVKEAMDFVGLLSTGGWAPLSSAAGGFDLFPERDAPVVARLRPGSGSCRSWWRRHTRQRLRRRR